jgi:16S rRNA (cytidine1402-2'-O)-methyltransferase
VLPLPGASAAVTALSASGLVNDQFYFVGFLPAKAKQRENFLGTLRSVTATMVFYEAPHRILDCASALASVFEPTRQVVFARELTKMFEEIHRCPLSEAEAWIKADAHREKGEFVVLLEGAPRPMMKTMRKRTACCKSCWPNCLLNRQPAWPRKSPAARKTPCTTAPGS